MTAADLVLQNLLSPMVLCFVLGIGARLMQSDLSLPGSVYSALSAYLLLAIGLKGGVALSQANPADLLAPLMATIALGLVIPTVTFHVCRRIGSMSPEDAGALACHYGSVSAVTFIAGQTFLRSAGIEFEEMLTALLAFFEVPGLVVGLVLARRAVPNSRGEGLGEVMKEILTGKSIVLLAGGLAIGALTGPSGYESVKPFFLDPFQGLLCLFLLEMGLLAATHLGDARSSGWFLFLFGTLGTLIFGMVGVAAGLLAGLSPGGASLMGIMAASASYIAAPAAVRIALPEANPGLYLAASIGITLPFNLVVGIPLYTAASKVLAGVPGAGVL